MAHVRSALVPLLSAVVVAGGVAMVRMSARLAAYERQHAEDVQALAKMRSAARQEPAPAEAAPAQPSAEVRPAAPASGRRGAAEVPERVSQDTAALELKRELAEAQASVSRLEGQLRDAGQAKQEAMAAAEDFQKREREWRDQLDGMKQQLDAARAESQAVRERAAALEADNARMKGESGAGGARVAEMRQGLASLQDLDRRRDGYLNSIMRHYRDITDQFRAMAGTLDSSHGAGSASFNGITLSRIQTAISQAEDDMRRLNELNSQARQIATRMAKN